MPYRDWAGPADFYRATPTFELEALFSGFVFIVAGLIKIFLALSGRRATGLLTLSF